MQLTGHTLTHVASLQHDRVITNVMTVPMIQGHKPNGAAQSHLGRGHPSDEDNRRSEPDNTSDVLARMHVRVAFVDLFELVLRSDELAQLQVPRTVLMEQLGE